MRLVVCALCIQLRLICNLLDGMVAMEGKASPVGSFSARADDALKGKPLVRRRLEKRGDSPLRESCFWVEWAVYVNARASISNSAIWPRTCCTNSRP